MNRLRKVDELAFGNVERRRGQAGDIYTFAGTSTPVRAVAVARRLEAASAERVLNLDLYLSTTDYTVNNHGSSTSQDREPVSTLEGYSCHSGPLITIPSLYLDGAALHFNLDPYR